MGLAEFDFLQDKVAANIWCSVGLPASGIKLHEQIAQGFSPHLLDVIAEHSLLDKQAILAVAGVPKRTFSRRLSDNNRLTPSESNAIARVLNVFQAALELFEGDTAVAKQWCENPVVGLGGLTPLQLAATEAGRDAVFELIGQLEHGVY